MIHETEWPGAWKGAPSRIGKEKVKWFYILIFVMLFSGCNLRDNNLRTLTEVDSGDIVDTLQIKVGVDMSFEPWDVSYSSPNKIYNLNREKVEIYVYFLDNSENSYKLKFNEFGPNGVGYMVNCYNYISSDSIYLIPNNEKTLIRVNENAEILQEIPIVSSGKIGLLVAKGGFHMEVIKGKAYIACLTNTYVSGLDESEITNVIEVVVDVESGNVLSTSSLPDKFYSEANTYLLDYSRTFRSEDERVYSFATSDDIYVMNQGGSGDGYEIIRPDTPFPVEKKSVPGVDEYYEYLMNDSYAFIVYDKYKDLYYRGVRLKMDLEEIKLSGNLTGQMDDKQPVILVYNSKWELVGTRFLEKNSYLLNHHFVTEKGLYISTDHPNSNTLNEDLMQFHCFQF